MAEKNGDVYPGMMFRLAKDRMEKSKLWKIVHRMPKGALLHCHLEAMVDLDWLFAEVMQTEGLCLTAKGPLNTKDGLVKTPFLFAHADEVPKDNKSIWTEQYEADSLVSLTEAAESFPDGGRAGFLPWLKSRFTITPEESLNHHEGVNEVWRKFTSIFPVLGSLIFYEPLFRKFIRRVFHQLREDGVQYVEFRHGFVAPYKRAGAESADEAETHMLTAFAEELEAFQATEEGKDFWGAQIIWSAIRRFDKKLIVESKLCFVSSIRSVN